MIRFTLDGVKHEFDDDNLSNTEVRAIRKATGLGFKEFWEAFAAMDDDAITAIVWVSLRKQDPELKFTAVEFNFNEFIGSIESDKVEETDDESDPPEAETTSGPS